MIPDEIKTLRFAAFMALAALAPAGCVRHTGSNPVTPATNAPAEAPPPAGLERNPARPQSARPPGS